MTEPTIFELSSPGRQGVRFPDADVPETALPEQFRRKELPLPEMAELDVVRHFTHISQFNYAVDIGYYPLGSCTMKYNPKANEAGARLPGFAFTHPLQPIETVQGNLALMYGLQEWLRKSAALPVFPCRPQPAPREKWSASRSSPPTIRTTATRSAPRCSFRIRPTAQTRPVPP